MINEFGECYTKIVNCHCGRGAVLPLPLHLGVGVVGGGVGGGGWWVGGGGWWVVGGVVGGGGGGECWWK